MITLPKMISGWLWAIRCLLCSLFLITVVWGQSSKLTDLGPNDHAELAVNFLLKVSPEDRTYIRFLSYYNHQNDPKLATYINLMKFWINNLHKESDIEFPKVVPNSNDLLYYLDLRDYNWNSAAWSSVAAREPYFVEPTINSGYAITLRALTNITQYPSTIHAQTYPCDTILRADWFMRDSSDQDRSNSYFDLLFAQERFVNIKTVTKQNVQLDWKGGLWNGAPMAAGQYYYEEDQITTKAAKKDFPKDETEFQKFFGIDITLDFIKKSGLNLQKGAVVEGNTSIVARNNRLIQRTYGPIGWYYKTFDVFETSGNRDFVETLQKEKSAKNPDGFVFDAGEILARLPAGGQAGLLVDSKGKILAVADNKAANDSSDYKFDTRVRTVTSCIVCHTSGIIKPVNLIEDLMKAGVDIKFKDKRDARDARSFFLNWDRKLKYDQEEFNEFIQRTSGLAPEQNSALYKEYRDLYDRPVTLQTAANEVGVSVNVFKNIGARSTKARVLMLVQGLTIPRRSWEVDGYFEMIKLMSAK